jgi:hypothetical protein
VSFNFEDLLETALEAVDDEIEAVRDQPSHDILFNGERQNYRGDSEYHYRFDTHNASIQYAEVIRAELEGKSLEVYPVNMDNGQITLCFPEDFGETINRVELEWENDFVLLKVREELSRAREEEEITRERIRALFDPQIEEHAAIYEVEDDALDDDMRNEAQREALRKALSNQTLYVWGPPGTGKTATLGFMAANYLRQDKKVLLASNTNRAVDVGLLNVLQAGEVLEIPEITRQSVRFGEPALDDARLLDRTFENVLEREEQKRNENAAKLDERLQQFYKLEQQMEDMDPDDPESEEVERTHDLVSRRVESEGGEKAL